MTKQEYIKEIMRALDVSKSEKKRIESDLDSDIQTALEHANRLTSHTAYGRTGGSCFRVYDQFGKNSSRIKVHKSFESRAGRMCNIYRRIFYEALLMKLTEVTAGGPDYRQSFY